MSMIYSDYNRDRIGWFFGVSGWQLALLAGADGAGHHPAPGGAEVDRGDGGHRKNAAATPASTGMCSPVVRDSSPAVSTNTAAATCSGRTSRLSSVRCA